MQTWMSRSLKAFGVVAIGATALSAPASAQDKLTLWSHVVHQQVVEGARGGAEVDLGAAFTDSTGTGLEWVTIAFAQMADKVKRELNLSNSEADIVFVVNAWADPSTLRQLVPLDEFMAASPIANMDDISPAHDRGLFRQGGHEGHPDPPQSSTASLQHADFRAAGDRSRADDRRGTGRDNQESDPCA